MERDRQLPGRSLRRSQCAPSNSPGRWRDGIHCRSSGWVVSIANGDPSSATFFWVLQAQAFPCRRPRPPDSTPRSKNAGPSADVPARLRACTVDSRSEAPISTYDATTIRKEHVREEGSGQMSFELSSGSLYTTARLLDTADKRGANFLIWGSHQNL